MNFKGGYKLIDLLNNSFTAGTPITIEGIYEAIEGNYGKRIVLTGFVVGEIEYDDVEVEVTVSSGDFVFEAYGYNFVITDDDEVTITAVTATTTATTTAAGTVKRAVKVEAIATPGTATAEAIATKVNDILTALKAAGIMEA